MLDEGDVEQFVEGADVVVHLAFIILGTHDETRGDQPRGHSQNVFEAAVACRSHAARVRLLGGGLRLLSATTPSR